MQSQTESPTTSLDIKPETHAIASSIDSNEHATGIRLFIIISSILAGIFLVALDQTIVATAIPKITNQFHSVEDIGWYGSSFLLTAAALTVIWGKIYQNFSIKYCYIITVAVFELGSLICGIAPNSTTLILGRAIAGLGASGIFSGALVIVAHEVVLEKRPIYIGLCGAIYGMSSIFGPLIGGTFTERVTWRWCFYINLPIGALVCLGVFFFARLEHDDYEGRNLRERIKQVDLLGALFFIPAIVCFILALQWGGSSQYAWNSSKVVGTFIGAGLFAIVFGILQIVQGDVAMLPPRICLQRKIWAPTLFSFFFAGDFFLLTYYLPIYFQSTKGSSAIHSAVQLLPFLVAVIISSIFVGGLVSKIGKFFVCLLPSITLMVIGSGLICTWTKDTSHAKWIGYQVLVGLGTGGSFNVPLTAIQAALDIRDIPTGTACVAFAQTLGGAIGIAIAQSLFFQNLSKSLIKNVPEVSVVDILQAGATGFRSRVQPSDVPLIAEAYMSGLKPAFICGLVSACLAVICALLVPIDGTVRSESARESEGGSVEKVA